ncbi:MULTISPECIES: response regulator [Alphaproteobacteria]|uniref:response regulator n=1 Tax=Alphaproteobacteria TaxID=28211 RepID=UPI000A3B27DD|nr:MULTISPECIES: response regulator [Alphaproteobacteria]MBC7285251.1 response regulator [Hoeflea sp.]MDM7945431.1 response regulator [Oceanibaculum nanhaiense]
MGRTRILIVEDEPNIIESLSYILRRADFDVAIAANGLEALERLRGTKFSAIILDVMMPGMSGFDVLRQVRADRNLSGLPVIVLTAKGQSRDRQTASEAGATEFITKPFSNADIIACLRQVTGTG